MVLLNDDYFEQFGFMTLRNGAAVDLTYGIIEEILSPLQLPKRSNVLFSVVHHSADAIKQTVTPAMLNMPAEPPFLITLNSEAEIVRLFDGNRQLADGLDFPHSRVAQYLALCHLSRAAGRRVDPEIIAFLTRSEMEWGHKLYTVLEHSEPKDAPRIRRIGFYRA